MTLGQVIVRSDRAVLHRAHWRELPHPIIAKTLHSELTPGQELQQLQRELQLAQLCACPHVVQAYALVTHDGRPTLLMEDFGGNALTTHLSAPLPMNVFFNLACQLTRAVQVLHSHAVLHKDINPQNVIVNMDTAQAKLTDFGIAIKMADTAADDGTRAESIEGTLAYLAPEQTGRTQRRVDCRTDLYAVGATLYQMLTGHLLFDAADALEWVHCHVAKMPLSPQERVAGIPDVLAQIVMKLLAKEPRERYQTAAGLLTDLERCAASWAQYHDVPMFALAQGDRSGELAACVKLYGRDAELAELKAVFTRMVQRGSPELVLVRGYSGVGKTSLVQQLGHDVTSAPAFFLTGKFDQFKRHVPYSALAQGLRRLIHQILAQPAQALEAWQQALTGKLGSQAGVIADVVPDLELLLGEQPPVGKLGPIEAQNRFNLVFYDFLSVCATKAHPLVIFLDDLQWVDGATLALLEALLTPGANISLMLIMSYRDNEVDAAHPFQRTLDNLKHAQLSTTPIFLEPLTLEAANALIGDTLRAPATTTQSLTELIVNKTHGNPFFVIALLQALNRDGLLHFDTANHRWHWDAEQIKRGHMADNVVHLMIDRMRSLTPTSQRVLSHAACIGHGFSLQQLSVATECTPDEARAALAEPLTAGLMVPDDTAPDGIPVFRFQHDRIQQAAYALIDDADKPGVHQRIGMLMLANLTPAQIDEHVFDLTHQLNQAELLWDASVQSVLVRLNTLAAKRAKAATAYASAKQYFIYAMRHVPDDAWQTHYAQAYELHTELAECAYLCGQFTEAEALFDTVITQAHSAVDRGHIYALQMRLYQVAGDFNRATDVALASFATFGLDVPDTDARAGELVGILAEKAKAQRAGRLPLTLVDAPRMTDPTIRTAMELLEASGPPIYMVRPALFAWVALQMVTLSLEYGNSEASCYGYAIYGILLAAAFGEVQTGYEFSTMAIALNDNFTDTKLKGCLWHMLGDHVNFWKNHIGSDVPILAQGFNACLESGDLIYSNYIGFQAPWHLLETGEPLSQVYDFTDSYLAFAQRSKHLPVVDTIAMERQFIRCLQAQTASNTCFDEGFFSEADTFARITAAKFGCGIVYYHIMKQVSAFLHADFNAARQAGLAAHQEIGAAFSMPIAVTHDIFYALTLAELCNDAQADVRQSYIETITACHAKVAQWAVANPANFLHKELLLAAELARLNNDTVACLRDYAESARHARVQSFTHYEAIACERAGHLYESMKVSDVALMYLQRARNLYIVWGATRKVQQLEAHYPRLRRNTTSHAHDGASAMSTTKLADLDLVPVVKISQGISQEMLLPKLLETLLAIVVEYAGADRGVLFLAQNDELSMEADLDLRLKQVNITGSRPLEEVADQVPRSVIHYVRRTNATLLIDDVVANSDFRTDPYVAQSQPRSILCFPFARHGILTGIIYLENRLITGAFDAQLMAVLDLLASQIAISIDNSRLYESAQQAIRLRDEFLAIASHELKTPLTPIKVQLQVLTGFMRRGQLADIKPERLKRMVDASDKQLDRLTALIDDLLDVTRINSGKLTLHPEPVELSELIQEVVARQTSDLAKAACPVTISCEPSLLGTWDRLRVEQVIDNLVNNAVKYAPGHPICIAARTHQGQVSISVEDQGPGIPNQDLARIFTRFERLGSVRNVGGLGLGLFIARQIIEAHGGTIEVQSTLGVGTTFTLNLPAAPAS
ncbi:sensor histidine kinase [Novosphingobium sp.]|uniref:sensor histidine kinase n=1 Tax=Novosphingobium sp. TaxID=1874826 RepID=UPI003D0BC1A0